MLQVAYSQVEMRTIRMGFVDPAALPGVVPAGGRANVVFAAATVPAREMWMVSWSGGVVEVDDARVQLIGMSMQVDAFSPLISLERFGTNFTSAPFAGIACTLSGAGTRWFFSVNLQGMVFFPGDVLALTGQVLNTDAGAAHNIVNTLSASMRVQPLLLVSELALAQLPQQQSDVNLSRRLGGR